MNQFSKITISLIMALAFLSSTILHAQEDQSAKKMQMYISGPDNAKIVIQEFIDYECGYCSKGSDVIKELVKNYPNDIRLVLHNLPLPFHTNANVAAKAVTAIYLQSPLMAEKFHYDLMKQQSLFIKIGEKFLYSIAHKIGVDVAKMKIDMNEPAVKAVMQEDEMLAKKNGFTGTPSFLIGDTKVQGAYDYEYFKNIVEKQLVK